MGGRNIHDIISNWCELNERGPKVRMKKMRSADSANHGSVSYAEDVLYSYRTPIARYFHDGHFAIVSSTKHSVTTARHCSRARRCIEWRTFNVPHLGIGGGWGSNPIEWHQLNLAHLRMRLVEIEEQAIRGYRSPYQDWWREQMGGYIRDIRDYLRLNKLSLAGTAQLKGLIDRVEAARQAKLAKFNDPKEVSRRERAAARRMAKEALNLPEIKK